MVTVRLALKADLPQLFELISAFPTPTTSPTDEYVELCLLRKIDDPNSYLAIAEDGNRLLAYISGYRHYAFYAGGQTAWCDELLVHEEKRGIGIGGLMMESFEHWARLHGCVLTSLATSGARKFYESIGYSSKAGYYKKYLV